MTSSTQPSSRLLPIHGHGLHRGRGGGPRRAGGSDAAGARGSARGPEDAQDGVDDARRHPRAGVEPLRLDGAPLRDHAAHRGVPALRPAEPAAGEARHPLLPRPRQREPRQPGRLPRRRQGREVHAPARRELHGAAAARLPGLRRARRAPRPGAAGAPRPLRVHDELLHVRGAPVLQGRAALHAADGRRQARDRARAGGGPALRDHPSPRGAGPRRGVHDDGPGAADATADGRVREFASVRGQGSKRERNSQLQRLRSRPFSTRFG